MARRRTTRQRAASKRNLVKARAKRRRRIAVGVVGTVAVGSVLGYRAYNSKVELAQKKHLEHKAWKIRVNSMPVEFDEDYLKAGMSKPHPQPKRYRKRPATIQSLHTIRAVRAQKHPYMGKAANTFGRKITTPSPIRIRVNRRDASRSAPKKIHKDVTRFNGMYGVHIDKRVGGHFYGLTYIYRKRP